MAEYLTVQWDHSEITVNYGPSVVMSFQINDWADAIDLIGQLVSPVGERRCPHCRHRIAGHMRMEFIPLSKIGSCVTCVPAGQKCNTSWEEVYQGELTGNSEIHN